MARTPNERIADTYQPIQPWIMGQMFGRLIGKLIALSMCRPPPKMVQVAIEAIGELPPDLTAAFESSSFRRRYRKAIKAEMLPGLKVETNGQEFRVCRLFLNELIESLLRLGYKSDEARIPKIDTWQSEYYAKTQEMIQELNVKPVILVKSFPPSKTLGYVRAKNAVPLLGGEENYYQHLTSLIYEIRSQPEKLKLSSGHVSDIKKSLSEKLGELIRLFNELNSEPINKTRMRIFVNNLFQSVDAEEEFQAVIQILVRYFLIETIPRVPSDEESNHKILPLIEEQIADGQEFTGTWRSSESGRKPMFKQTNKEEPLEDGERLSQIASLAGIKLDDLTPGDQKRLLEHLDAIDNGYEKSSKTGMSFKDYFGDRADSEKTQWQRLEKKIKRLAKSDSVSSD